MSILIAEVPALSTRIRITDYDDVVHKGQIECLKGHKLIAKRGQKVSHHFAHAKSTEERSCAELYGHHCNKGQWHINQQARIRTECLEVPMRDGDNRLVHIADACCPPTDNSPERRSTVVEFQWSPISKEKIQDREHFYQQVQGHRMCWVFYAGPDSGIDMRVNRQQGDLLFIDWKLGPKFSLDTSTHTFFDMGDGDYLYKLQYSAKTKRLVCRIIRSYEFDAHWIGNQNLQPNALYDRDHLPVRNRAVGTITNKEEQELIKAFLSPSKNN